MKRKVSFHRTVEQFYTDATSSSHIFQRMWADLACPPKAECLYLAFCLLLMSRTEVRDRGLMFAVPSSHILFMLGSLLLEASKESVYTPKSRPLHPLNHLRDVHNRSCLSKIEPTYDHAVSIRFKRRGGSQTAGGL
jgi:hypothetical protein